MLTAGIDVGSSAVKCAVVESAAASEQVLALHSERIRRRDIKTVVYDAFAKALESSRVDKKDLAYVASTGDGEMVDFRKGHFYSMTTHARGALHLMPEARSALDVGALHGRALCMDGQGRVLNYRMTSQCASGSGQFLENISRYLGISLDEIGPLSLASDKPEEVSSICAVLAETDVINMVSRGILIPNILKGIHLSMAGRFAKLLRSVEAQGTVALTGGIAQDCGLSGALQEILDAEGASLRVVTHPDAVFAGAIGAGIFAAFRERKLREEL